MGKRGALAVVVNPTGAAIFAPGLSSDDSVSEDMVRGWIAQDLERRPELRAQAVAIEEVAILANADISPLNFVEDMTSCYVAQMQANNWAAPEGLHVFEAFMGPLTVYIAYGSMADQGGPGSPKAGWYADPVGRHQYRYWDGAQWTPHVADDGVASLDELQATAGAQGPRTEPGGQGQRPAGEVSFSPDVKRLAAERDVGALIEVVNKVGIVPDTHCAAARALGTIGDPRAVPALVRALKDRYSNVRRAAAVALGCIGDARAFQPLIAALGDENGFMRTATAEALGRIGDPRAVEPIVAAIKVPYYVGSYKPVPALVQIGGPAVEPLVAALRDENHNVRYWSAITLGQIGDPRAVEPLIAALKDSNGPVRREAAEALRALGRPDAIEVSTGAQEAGGSLSGLASSAGPEQLPPTTTVESSLAALVSNDHELRKSAITALSLAGYRDPEEPRTLQILGNLAEWDDHAAKDDLRAHPDFDVAYVRAAYPTGRGEDHPNAYVAILLDGVVKCRRRGYLLARLSSYYTWQEDWLRALDYATAAVLLGEPAVGPSDMVQVMELFAGVFSRVGLPADAETAAQVQASYSLGPAEAAAVAKAVATLVNSYSGDVRWAADTVREKLTKTLEEKLSVEGRDSGEQTSAHDRAHEMIARLQVLIAKSSEAAIPGYLRDKSTVDIVEAVGICDNLLQDSEDPTSLYHVVVGQAREAFLQEMKRR